MTPFERLKALTLAATPGPWLKSVNAPNVELPEGGILCWTRATSDANYIAVLSPEYVAKLIACVLAADAMRDRLPRIREHWTSYDAARAALDADP